MTADPSRCAVCGSAALLEPCDAAGAMLCPFCRSCFRWLRERFPGATLESEWEELRGTDSLAVCEFLLDLEDEFGVELLEESLREIKTTRDLIRHLNRHRSDAPG